LVTQTFDSKSNNRIFAWSKKTVSKKITEQAFPRVFCQKIERIFFRDTEAQHQDISAFFLLIT